MSPYCVILVLLLCNTGITAVISEKQVPDEECDGCNNRGVCTVFHNDPPACVCGGWFYGVHCEIDTRRKLGYDCRYDTECTTHGKCGNETGVCACEPSYYGERCQVSKDKRVVVSTSTVIGIAFGLATVILTLVVYWCMRYGIGQYYRDRQISASRIPVLTTTGFPCRLHDSYESPTHEHPCKFPQESVVTIDRYHPEEIMV
ncbi:uncharacterized protein LOC144440508 [Glandiceps talaboti]